MIRTQTKARASVHRGPASAATDIARRLADRIDPLTRDILGEPTLKRPRAWRWGAHQSLIVHVAGERRGRWHSFEENRGGDALDLVAWTLRMNLRDALAWARVWLGGGK